MIQQSIAFTGHLTLLAGGGLGQPPTTPPPPPPGDAEDFHPYGLCFATGTIDVTRCGYNGVTYTDSHYWACAHPSTGDEECIFIAEEYARQTLKALVKTEAPIDLLARIAEDQLLYWADPRQHVLIRAFWEEIGEHIAGEFKIK